MAVCVAGGGSSSQGLYLALKGLANAYWYALWIIVLATLWKTHGRLTLPALWTALALGYAYFYAIHSIFESNSKYHVPVLALLAILVAVLLSRIPQQSTSSSGWIEHGRSGGLGYSHGVRGE
jgi:hypothetical protein